MYKNFKNTNTNTLSHGRGNKAAFTLAEVLITLAVIGIVAVLTIPALVQNNNEKAWSTAKDLFAKKIDIAMKQMNTDGTLTGYDTTLDFVNALKKNIKITQICTDDVTKCFAKNITFGKYNPQVVSITNDNIKLYTNQGQEWAETVGVRFANGINALIAYNKNCTDDPFNNQYSPSAECIGIVYDVQANKQPNTYGKDINVNQNIAKIDGKGFCAYDLADGTCFSKILAPDTGYSPMTRAECDAAVTEGKLGIKWCYYDGDYWAGAVAACGGTNKLPSEDQLTALAQEIFNDTSITSSFIGNLTMDTEKATPFRAQSPYSSFKVWANVVPGGTYAFLRYFDKSSTNYSNYLRTNTTTLAVCIED